jgi:CheY-like chemotaxis protein
MPATCYPRGRDGKGATSHKLLARPLHPAQAREETTMDTMSLPRGPRILIADADDTHATWVWHVLRQAGYRPRHVPVASLAAAVPEVRYVIVGVDAGHAGLALLADLQRLPGARDRRIVALHGGSRRAGDALRRAGASAALGKPVSPQELVDAMERLTAIAPRRPVAFGLTLLPDRGGDGATGRSLNMSDTGILVSCPADLTVGDGVLLHASAPRGDVTLRSFVVRRAEERGPGHWALRFDHPSRAVHDAMSYLGLSAAV